MIKNRGLIQRPSKLNLSPKTKNSKGSNIEKEKSAMMNTIKSSHSSFE